MAELDSALEDRFTRALTPFQRQKLILFLDALKVDDIPKAALFFSLVSIDDVRHLDKMLKDDAHLTWLGGWVKAAAIAVAGIATTCGVLYGAYKAGGK